ncbi:MAG: hypothetical protein AAF654_04050 [Myxococcota bacterium]
MDALIKNLAQVGNARRDATEVAKGRLARGASNAGVGAPWPARRASTLAPSSRNAHPPMLRSEFMKQLWLILALGGCAGSSIVTAPREPAAFYVTVDRGSEELRDDPLDVMSFTVPVNYLDACSATPTPLIAPSRTERQRARAVAETVIRWPRELCRCVSRAMGPGPLVRAPESVSVSLFLRGSPRPVVADRIRFEGRTSIGPCLANYLRARPLPAGPGPLEISFKLNVHPSQDTLPLYDEIAAAKPDFAACWREAPKPWGSVRVSWVIDAKGQPREVNVVESRLGLCVGRVVDRLRFPRCRGCVAEYEVPPP